MNYILKIFSKDNCPICSLDKVASIIRSMSFNAIDLGISTEFYNIDEPEGLAEAALERIATASMPIILMREK